MRPIDADALMSAIIFDDHIPCGNAFQHTVLQIEQAPTLETEPAKQWISCSEQMPEEGQSVLAVVDGTVREAGYCYDAFFGSGFYRDAREIEWWMPLPNPPKGGTENGNRKEM